MYGLSNYITCNVWVGAAVRKRAKGPKGRKGLFSREGTQGSHSAAKPQPKLGGAVLPRRPNLRVLSGKILAEKQDFHREWDRGRSGNLKPNNEGKNL
jgi:hypothetical protein